MLVYAAVHGRVDSWLVSLGVTNAELSSRAIVVIVVVVLSSHSNKATEASSVASLRVLTPGLLVGLSRDAADAWDASTASSS
jgi:hypothetical protein